MAIVIVMAAARQPGGRHAALRYKRSTVADVRMKVTAAVSEQVRATAERFDRVMKRRRDRG
jgi:hypothetical protein